MKKKLLLLLVGSVLSAMMVTGCNANNDQNPAPPVNDEVDTPLDNNGTLDGDDNGTNMNNRTNNMNNRNVNNRNDLNNRNTRYQNDINTPNDMDPVRDRNTRGEEMFEDRLDRNDRDNRDR
ncbi:hypothetical protein [Bacillus sp. MRMR6]|uniref:hypothetical protein n=1 Tax=Bacillus sp. MRMR6 TaxID=1928617 RepID=UPI000951DB92|nr:hypothetical protein [Bacillus sp. MRMR6]OLS41137.1 hypothetical protein BTR25_04550 [Bacillus sp. MRMR6]